MTEPTEAGTWQQLTLSEALSHIHLTDPEHAYLAGARAVEAHVGHTALAAARFAHDADLSGDVDLVVSRQDYRALRLQGAMVVRHAFPRIREPGLYRVNSLSVANGLFDIWRERWYEPARWPHGAVGVEELRAQSTWNDALGLRVLSLDYLIAQRQRSVAFLESKQVKELTRAEQRRLAKDKADLTALLQRET